MSRPFYRWLSLLIAGGLLAAVPVLAQQPASVSEPAILEALGDIRLKLVRIETALKGEITRAETALKGEVARLDTRQGATELQLKTLRDDLRWGGGLLLTAMLALVGFVVWDRRTAVAPTQRRIERLEEALKEIATSNPVVAEALRNARIASISLEKQDLFYAELSIGYRTAYGAFV